MKIKKLKCKICNKDFTIEIQTDENNGFFKKGFSVWNRNMCSDECRYQNGIQSAQKQNERNKQKIIKRKCRECGKEVISNFYSINNFCEGSQGECYKNYLSKTRQGKNNPGYRNGLSVGRENLYTSRHFNACNKYRKEFLAKNQYLFCEICNTNSNGTLKFEVHHIYYASLHPKHKELHNFKNLIMLCIECHNKMHSGKMRSQVFLQLEQDRKLKELFI